MATMSAVWDRAAEFLSDNLATVAPLALLTLFVPLALFGTVMPLIGESGMVGDALLGLLLLALAIVTVWGGLALTALAFDPAGGHRQALTTATRRLLPVLGAGIVILVVVIVLLLPLAAAHGLSAMDADDPTEALQASNAKLFVALYLPIIGLVLLWLAARLALINAVIVMERRGLGAFARSFALTARVQWKLVGVILLYLIVSQVAAFAGQTVFGSLLRLAFGGEGGATVASVLTAIIVAAISTLFSLLAIAFTARLYLAARDARDPVVDGAPPKGSVSGT